MSRCTQTGHVWEPHPLAWYVRGAGWVAAYRCLHCATLDERPVAGPGLLPEGNP